ncbi:conserved hypothetical protein [Theileria orientalis strain Shintoku]|uniref:Uncharacterized protein n=1 Tax=Theileria orientalis strain Shintoku TaxID=869250 RepID=J4DNF8_THEOR|nr:conserved hypothetical protein [Theileria orientalis strain Shintoku]BAM38884.1 conserved hypothetical protein [Theileria orientalis strain Shintoku]|eukprot:XP_009689185.1 conserved hypothetical protein [Theileria orientalis strain Shintoku]
MSKPAYNIKNLLNSKLFILISIVLLASISQVNGLRYNRGPLEEAYPSRHIETVDDDDEFTGSTYIESSKENRKNQSMFGNNNDDDDDEDNDDDNNDEEEESEDFLDRADESTLLELSRASFLEENKGKSERVDDNKLKQYLIKIGAIDKIKRAKETGQRAISGLKSKFKNIPEGVKKLKNKIVPPKPYFTKSKSGQTNSDHGKRLLNTINEVDASKRIARGNISIPPGKRLLHTMNDVERKKSSRKRTKNFRQ